MVNRIDQYAAHTTPSDKMNQFLKAVAAGDTETAAALREAILADQERFFDSCEMIAEANANRQKKREPQRRHKETYQGMIIFL